MRPYGDGWLMAHGALKKIWRYHVIRALRRLCRCWSSSGVWFATSHSLPPEFSDPSGKKLSKIKPYDLKQALASACNQLRNAILDGSEPSVLPSSLSGGMVYLLRFLDTRGYSVAELAAPLVHFQTKAKFADLPANEQEVWKKATQYACQCLQALGAADSYDGNRGYRISEEGRRLLRSERLRQVFDSEMKRKKIRIIPVERVPRAPGTSPKTR